MYYGKYRNGFEYLNSDKVALSVTEIVSICTWDLEAVPTGDWIERFSITRNDSAINC